MSLSIGMISQRELSQDYGVRIKNELATKFSGLKITFPAGLSDEGLNALGLTGLVESYNIRNFSQLVKGDVDNLASVGITNEKIKQIAHLANYYAEKHYLGKKDQTLESDLEILSREGYQFTVCASTSDRDQAKNLAFNHSWQKNSSSFKY